MGTATTAADILTLVAVILAVTGLVLGLGRAARAAACAVARRWREGPRKGPGLAPHIEHPQTEHPHLDESAERVMPQDELRPRDLAVIQALDGQGYHPNVAGNARVLADRLRRELPDLSDVQIARVCVALTKYACVIHSQLPRGQWWPTFTDALGLACVELSAMQRAEHPDFQPGDP